MSEKDNKKLNIRRQVLSFLLLVYFTKWISHITNQKQSIEIKENNLSVGWWWWWWCKKERGSRSKSKSRSRSRNRNRSRKGQYMEWQQRRRIYMTPLILIIFGARRWKRGEETNTITNKIRIMKWIIKRRGK